MVWGADLIGEDIGLVRLFDRGDLTGELVFKFWGDSAGFTVRFTRGCKI